MVAEAVPAAEPAAPAGASAGAEAPTLLPGNAQPRLLVLRGQKRNVEYPIYEGRNTIGRFADKPVDIDLVSQESVEQIWCSRQHAVITFDRGTGVIYEVNPYAVAPRAHALRKSGKWSHADWQPACNILGRRGNHVLKGTSRPELICAHKGNDTIYAGRGGDRIYAGGGNDKVYGGGGNDFVEAGTGTDFIDGGPGNDHIEGGTGNDRIRDAGRGSGSDVLKGESGTDVMVADDGVRGNDNIDGGSQTDTCTVDNRTNVVPGDFVWECERITVG